jgi:hypothetical protein
MTLAEEGGICKAMESHQAADDELEMYAMKNNSLGIKSKYKHDNLRKAGQPIEGQLRLYWQSSISGSSRISKFILTYLSFRFRGESNATIVY